MPRPDFEFRTSVCVAGRWFSTPQVRAAIRSRGLSSGFQRGGDVIMRLICSSCSAVVDLASLEPGGEMLCPCCDSISVFEAEETPQESLLRVAAEEMDGRMLEDPAFPISSVFAAIGAEYSTNVRPPAWAATVEQAADLNATAAAESSLSEPAVGQPEDGGGLFAETAPQRRKELDPALVNGLLLKARNLHARCQFQEASQLLRTMSEGRKSAEVTSISVQSLYLANLQAAAREAFARAQRGEADLAGCPEVSRYFDALKSYGLSDTDLEDRIWRLQRSRTRVKSPAGSSRLVAVILLLGLLVGMLSLLKAGMTVPAGLQPPDAGRNSAEAEDATNADKTSGDRGRFGEALTAAAAGDFGQAVELLNGAGDQGRGSLAESLDGACRERVRELTAAGTAEGREEAIRHLAGMQGVLKAADPGSLDLKVRRVRCQSLQLMADLMSQTGNYAGAFDALTAAAQLTPDLPGQEQLATAIADRMVSQLENGSGGLTAELVIPELDAGAGYGLPAEMQASLKGRAESELLKRAISAARSGKPGELKLSVEGFQSLQRRGGLDRQLRDVQDQFAGALLEQFDSALAAGDSEGAWLRLAAAVELGADPGKLANAQGRMVAVLGRGVLEAVQRQDATAAAVGCERLRGLLGKLPFSLEQALCRMSREDLQYLPSDIRAGLLQTENSIGMTLSLLTPGTLQMGAEDAPQSERVKSWSALPTHKVELSEACYLGATEVTVKQYHEVLQLRARSGEEFPENHPYVSASWFMAAEFCRRLTALPGELAAGRRYRLPTEAEWEYGCRAGTADDYCFGNDVTRLPDFAWLSYNSGLQSIETMLTFYSNFEELQRQTARSRTRPHPVGLRKPNAWGLYDMHGNAAEWTADWFAEYQAGPQRNPEGPAEGSEKVVRGGNWNADAISVRSGHRQALQPEFGRAGFRVVMERVAVAGTP